MATTQTQNDSSTEPEYTDSELRDAVSQLADVFENDWQLDLVTGGMYVQQLDNPKTDDCSAITVYMDGDVGSGATKATIIQKVLDSDAPVKLRNTCEEHGMVEFTADI